MSAAKTRRRGCGRVLLVLLLFVGLAAGAGAFWVRQQLLAPFQGYSTPEVTVEVPAGSSALAILGRLERAGVIRNARLAALWLVRWRGNPPLRAGEYRFNGPLSTAQALEIVIRGEVVTHPVTVVEGWSLEETVEHLAQAGFGKGDALRRAAEDPAAIRDLDPDARTLEGYLFPDTYAFARNTSETEIVATMVRTFRSRAEPAIHSASSSGRTLRQVVTLASIVEEEAQLGTERPLIAAVYANRLRLGMGLYADPTVIYALKRRGGYDGNVHREDLQVDDPYNTYRYPGLPPGPICSPGLASLEAAAHPANAPYLYFVSRNDGSHAFATTLEEHNHNVEIFQKRYWRERWAAERKP